VADALLYLVLGQDTLCNPRGDGNLEVVLFVAVVVALLLFVVVVHNGR